MRMRLMKIKHYHIVRESKHDIKDSEANMSNPIVKENVQEQKHPVRCIYSEPELPSYRNRNAWMYRREPCILIYQLPGVLYLMHGNSINQTVIGHLQLPLNAELFSTLVFVGIQ